MTDLENSISYSLDGSGNPDLYPFLPHILQDLWELGASPKSVIELIKRNNINSDDIQLRILDLGCGKGAVSIPVAKELNAIVHGVDGLPEFITEANKKAIELSADNLYTFEAGDIREFTKQKHDFDVVILAAVGAVLGNMEETIAALSRCIKPDGYIIIDDGYIPDNADFKSNVYIKERDYFDQINKSCFEIIDSISMDEDELESIDSDVFEKIKKRIAELIIKNPDKRLVLEKYLQTQVSENYIIENNLLNICILLKRKPD